MGLSILFVEQHVAVACQTADEVLVMNKGWIVWCGKPNDLLATNPGSKSTSASEQTRPR